MKRLVLLTAGALASAAPSLAQQAPSPAQGASRDHRAATGEEPRAHGPGTAAQRTRTQRKASTAARPRAAEVRTRQAGRTPAEMGRASRIAAAPPAHPVADPAAAAFQGGAPAWRLRGGIPLTWRTADVRPEAGAGSRFDTGTPYLGLEVEGQLFPEREFSSAALPRWAEPVGVSLSLSQRFLTSTVGAQDFASREQRAALDVLYERRVAPRTLLTGRLGWAWHRFGVEDGAPIRSATHHGPRLGVEAMQALHPLVSAVAGVSWMPWVALGGGEARARGTSNASWGAEAQLGAEGPLPGVAGLGWRVVYDWLHFSDGYSGPGEVSVGGNGTANHHAVLFGVTWQR